jgi:hypothetical protein
MESNQEFMSFIAELKANVLHVDQMPTCAEKADIDLVLRSIANIGAIVRDEIERVFPDKNMGDDECAAVVELEGILLRLRGQAKIRLAAIEEFERMTASAVTQ